VSSENIYRTTCRRTPSGVILEIIGLSALRFPDLNHTAVLAANIKLLDFRDAPYT
jgi:hypothetical protein